MNIKWKLNYAHYDKEDGISYVEISTHLGIFVGYSYLHDEDKDIASNFQGCRYAEQRAVLSYLKEYIKKNKEKKETILKLYKNLQQMRVYKYVKNNKDYKYIENEIKKLEEKEKFLQTSFLKLKENLEKKMNDYRTECEEFNKKIEKLKKEKQEPVQEN